MNEEEGGKEEETERFEVKIDKKRRIDTGSKRETIRDWVGKVRFLFEKYERDTASRVLKSSYSPLAS